MPRYTNPAGVVVDIPAELAEHLHGYTPADSDPDAAVSVTGPGAGGGGGGGAVGIGGYTLAQWADWLEAEEDHRVMVETWLEAEEAAKKAEAETAAAAAATKSRRTGSK